MESKIRELQSELAYLNTQFERAEDDRRKLELGLMIQACLWEICQARKGVGDVEDLMCGYVTITFCGCAGLVRSQELHMTKAEALIELASLVRGAEDRLTWMTDEGIDDTMPEIYAEQKGYLRGLRDLQEMMQ